MLLTKHKTTDGSRWAVDGHFLPPGTNLSTLLEMPREKMFQTLKTLSKGESASGKEEAPIDPQQEVWAAGVTYLRSRDARKAESTVADMYQKVYEAERPEIFPSHWVGVCQAMVRQSVFAKTANGMCLNLSWC